MPSTSARPGMRNASQTRYFGLARHALASGLRVAGIGPGKYVLLPAYICRDLLASVHAVGAKPLFYDTTELLEPTLDPSVWPEAHAVIAVNYFGFPQPLEPFKAYCHRTGACLIEDNAHGFLSRDHAGAWLGARGQLGIFSLRKTCRLPNGAALIANQPSLEPRLEAQVPSERSPESLFSSGRNALRGSSGAGRRLAMVMTRSARGLRRMRTGHPIPPPAADAEWRIPAPAGPFPDLLRRLDSLDYLAETARRRALYAHWAERAVAAGARLVFPRMPDGVVPYGLPVFQDDATRLIRDATGHGYDCFRWPDLPEAIAIQAPAHYKRLYVVNFL